MLHNPCISYKNKLVQVLVDFCFVDWVVGSGYKTNVKVKKTPTKNDKKKSFNLEIQNE